MIGKKTQNKCYINFLRNQSKLPKLSEVILYKNILICRKLKRLNLGGNGLTSIPQRSLSILDTLKKLELQENRISDIREGDFEGKSYFFFLF